jgi:hypothetical protein
MIYVFDLLASSTNEVIELAMKSPIIFEPREVWCTDLRQEADRIIFDAEDAIEASDAISLDLINFKAIRLLNEHQILLNELKGGL